MSYTITKQLFSELAEVLTEHRSMQLHGGSAVAQDRLSHAAQDSTTDLRRRSTNRIKAFLGLAPEDNDALAAALSLCFPRMAMGWQAFDLFTQEQVLAQGAEMRQGPKQTNAAAEQHDTRIDETSCATLRCSWKRILKVRHVTT